MKAAFKALLGMAAVLAVVLVVQAADKDEKGKEVTLKGTITCGKCDLKESKTCANVIQVKEDGKEVVYWFKDAGAKEKYHGKVCRSPKTGSVTGVVSKEKDKNYITPSKDGVKFD